MPSTHLTKSERLFLLHSFSESIVSQQLQKLEEEIGVPIFDRSTTPMKLTYVGMEYMNVIKHIVFEYRQVLNWIEDSNELKNGKITIGMSDNRTVQVLPLVLPSFKKKYPNIDVILKEMRGLMLPIAVKNGDIDLALMTAEMDNTELNFIPVFKEEVLLAVPPQFSFNKICEKCCAKHGYMDIALCKDEPFILMTRGYRFRDLAENLFAEANISPRIVLKTANVDLAHKMTSAGLGLSLVAKIATELNEYKEKPKYYSITKEKYYWSLGISYSYGKYVTKAMQAFIDHFLEETKWLSSFYK